MSSAKEELMILEEVKGSLRKLRKLLTSLRNLETAHDRTTCEWKEVN